MKKKIRNFIYKLAKKVIYKRLIRGHQLTPYYLKQRGWIERDGYYLEPIIKDRDRVSIKFENSYYRVWHGARRMFIALESSIEWLEMYMLLLDKHRNLKDLIRS